VVAFTAEQIPGISGRVFPASLAGRRYPDGIRIHPEAKLERLIRELAVDEVVLAYSDLAHQEVMEKASRVLAAGASFTLLGPKDSSVTSRKPVIAVTAVRTGCGKSQTARAIAEVLRAHDVKPIAIRHSMPYGKDLSIQTCQRFETAEDFARHRTTIEEEEEYQPWLDHGFVIYAGFDYKEIVRAAEREGDVLIFDGGNNDFSMIAPDMVVTVVDPHRAGHETGFYPGMVNLLMADVVIVNKVDSASKEGIASVVESARKHAPEARVIKARSQLRVDHPELIKGKRCLAVGDGPTLTHGGMTFGAGTLAVEKYGGKLVDPRPHLKGSLAATRERYPHMGRELPAMGYGKAQVRDLQATIAAVKCDVVVDGSPANLSRILDIERPVVKVGYELDARSVRALTEELHARKLI
jgi:predicted GTPase